MNGRWWGVAAIVLLAASPYILAPGSAAAQQALTIDQIRACACEEQAIAQLRQRNDAAKAVYDDRVQHEQRLTQQIDQLRYSMDPNDLAAQDQLRELLDLRARVAQDRRDTALPGWQQATKRLNSTVADYNANCASHPVFKTDDEAARRNLVCPVNP